MDSGEATRYESFSDFYEDAYGNYITHRHPAGRSGATLIRAELEAGDWSDAATPDLVLFLPRTNLGVTLDLGAGRFKTVCGATNFTAVSPGQAATVIVDRPHKVDLFSVPYANLMALAGGDDSLPADGDFGQVHTAMFFDPEVRALLDRLFSEIDAGSPRGSLYADAALLHIAARLLEIRDSRRPVRAGGEGGLAPWQVKRVCESMIAAMEAGEEESSLADLALLVGLSANHFCKGFAKSTGSPPHRWMTERRIERAKSLMADPCLSLAEVALSVGYTSHGTFGRAFKRIAGVSPLIWRRDREK